VEQFFEKARAYIAIFRTLEYHLEEEMAKKVQYDFVEMRKKDPRIKQESFHLWLTLSRLLALSFGQETLKEEIWMRMLSMEDARLSRLV
jgi:DNA replicative helicase MCM subunit Mcm2 (Cdc46/Mcm family)